MTFSMCKNNWCNFNILPVYNIATILNSINNSHEYVIVLNQYVPGIILKL